MTTPPDALSYSRQERARATAWKLTSPSLPFEARQPAGYVGKDGAVTGAALDFCLPPQHAALSLLPEVRATALALFQELGVPWHAGIGGGPSNHLLSSQVQCVNALGQAVHDPDRLVQALGDLLGIDEVLEVEPGRCLTFEYIGPDDVFGEAPTGERVRGAHCTSLDAAFLHRARDGEVELVLLEWKYTESYQRPRRPEPVKDAVRRSRYAAALALPDSPVRGDLVPFEDLLDEPLYQRLRQQLLAAELERRQVLGASRVRVVNVAPAGNDDLQASLVRPSTSALGGTVDEVWARLLRRPDRFTRVDSAVFLDAAVTSPEYCARYGTGDLPGTASLVRGPQDLRRLAGDHPRAVEGWLDFEGEVLEQDDGVELQLGRVGVLVTYPFQPDDLAAVAEELEQGCPRCGSALVPVVHGLPGPDLVEAARRGELVLGGCLVPVEEPFGACPHCSDTA